MRHIICRKGKQQYRTSAESWTVNWIYKALICCLIFDRAQPNGYFARYGVEIFQGHVISDLDRSNWIIAANAFALALIYPFGYTFLANFVSSTLLNISNQGKMSKS